MSRFLIDGEILIPKDSDITEEVLLDKLIDFVESIDCHFIGITEFKENEK